MEVNKNSTPLHLKTPKTPLSFPDTQTVLLILSILFFIGSITFWIYASFILK